jgi:hypothetical protein
MSFIEMLRAYTLREYVVVLAMAVLGALGLVFMLNSMGGGASTGETLLKRETTVRKQTASLRFVESNAAGRARAKALAARRARIRSERQVLAARAARRAAAAAARRAPAPKRTVVRATPRAIAPAPTRVVNTAPSPTPRPQPAPAPKPTPQKSGTSGGGGGGSFDDSG